LFIFLLVGGAESISYVVYQFQLKLGHY